MTTSDNVAQQSEQLADLIEDRLGIRGRGLKAKLRRAGRLMPRWVRREAERLVDAQTLLDHPKLMKQADPAALETAYRRVETWLKTVNPAERRKDRILGFLAVNAANLLIVAGLFVAYLVWAGHV